MSINSTPVWGQGTSCPNIDRAATIRRFDAMWELVNDPAKKNSQRDNSPVLEVLTFKDLSAREACFLAERHGAGEVYAYGEIRDGRIRLRKEYSNLALKGAERRERRVAWNRFFKKAVAH